MTLFFKETEEDLNFGKWKTNSISQEMEDDLNFSGNGRRPQFQKMEDDINFSGNGRLPQIFRKWKTTSSFQFIEDDLSLQKMEDHLNSILASQLNSQSKTICNSIHLNLA
jgi:hypothetical protein